MLKLSRLRVIYRQLDYLRHLLKHWFKEAIRNIQNAPIDLSGMGAVVDLEPWDEEETQELFIPGHYSVRLEGDGYVGIFHNTSTRDKSIYMTVRHRSEEIVWKEPPPTYEGDELGN